MILNWVWQPNRIVILGCGTQSQLQSALAGASDKHSFCGKCLVRGFTVSILSLLQLNLNRTNENITKIWPEFI